MKCARKNVYIHRKKVYDSGKIVQIVYDYTYWGENNPQATVLSLASKFEVHFLEHDLLPHLGQPL